MHRFERWREILQASHTEAAVRNAMQGYAQTMAPGLVDALPPEVRQALENEDIQAAAVTLLHAEMRHHGSDEIAELLHEIAHTYAAASVRLSKLKREPLTPSED